MIGNKFKSRRTVLCPATENCSPKKSGFTLIELMVALAIFVIISVVAVSVFLSNIKGQRKSFASQNVEDNGRFMMESLIKEIRMAKIKSADGESATLSIGHPINGDIAYNFDGTNLTRKGIILNGSDVEVSGKFYVRVNDVWPKVTITMKVKSKSTKTEEQAEVNLQNSVSSRAFNN